MAILNGIETVELLHTLKGDKGDRGFVFTPNVSADGTLSWTNDGDLANPTPVNIIAEATADNFENILNAFNTSGGYNILDPANYELGYYGANFEKFSTTRHHRTVNPIQIPTGKTFLVFATSAPTTDAGTSSLIQIMFADSEGALLSQEGIKCYTCAETPVAIPEGARQFHLWTNGINYGYTFDTICVAFGSRASRIEFSPYGELKKVISLKDDFAPTDFIIEKANECVQEGVAKLTTDKAGVNKYKPTTIGFEDGCRILADGTVSPSAGFVDYAVSPLIPIEANTVYTHTRVLGDGAWDAFANNNKLYTYDASGTPISTVSLVKNADGSVTFTTPSNASYIRIGIQRNQFANYGAKIETVITAFNERFMLVLGEECPSEFIPYMVAEKSPIREKVEEILDEKNVESALPFANATIVNFGDSIFGKYRPPKDISTFLANKTGATVHNCGFGGCTMGKHWSNVYDAFSMANLATAIASGDFSVQDVAITDTSLPAYFADTLALIKSIDFNNVDIITIAYGTNDFGSGYAVDSVGDIRSFGGALRYSIERILNAFPHIKVFVCSPIWRFWMNESGEFVEDSDTKVLTNTKLTDYVSKAKEIANEYHLPFIDNYYELGLNKFNRMVYFPATDGTHPNEVGRNLIADHIASKLF